MGWQPVSGSKRKAVESSSTSKVTVTDVSSEKGIHLSSVGYSKQGPSFKSHKKNIGLPGSVLKVFNDHRHRIPF